MEGKKIEALQMEREYTRAWAIFEKEVLTLLPYLEKMATESTDPSGLLWALRALSISKLEAPELRQAIIAKLSSSDLRGNILEGLLGLAQFPEGCHELATRLADALKVDDFSMEESIQACWSLLALGCSEHPVVDTLLKKIS